MENRGYASGGAVYQEGKLPIVGCRFCHDDIVWATSRRTGRRYPVSLSRGGEFGTWRYYNKRNFHNCRSNNERKAA